MRVMFAVRNQKSHLDCTNNHVDKNVYDESFKTNFGLNVHVATNGLPPQISDFLEIKMSE